jgi:hypothetical protein
MNITTRPALDTLRDVLDWLEDSVRCVKMDPAELAQELREIMDKQGKEVKR